MSRIQHLIDQLRSTLSLKAAVTSVIVEENPMVVSVEPVRGRPGAFVLSFEKGFTEALSDDELTAVIAHELGHVWIFTHHPYLQTERLANDVAMRVVKRESLQRVYAKLWERAGAKGDLAQFLGQ
ncbi:MAG: M48 family metalloprotease [Ardenticatenaceae bacterium]